jgi:LysR family carnitine catabolism transcriptional activator
MDLRQLRYLVAIVDHGGFTSAAARLGISQPSLSHAIKALENELGATLLHRLGRTVALTAAGEALLGPARQTLRDADVAQAAVREVIGLEAGRLDLVCLPTLAVDPVAAMVGRFRAHHPSVRVRIDEPEDADAVADQVRTGASELGVAELPVESRDLTSIELGAHEFVAALPVDTALALGDQDHVSLRQLAALPLVTTPVGTSTRRQIDEAFNAAGLQPTIAVETDHREAIIAMVLTGAGAAIVPAPLAASAHGAVIRAITPTIRRKIGLIRRQGPLSPAAQAFIALTVPGMPATASRPPARRRRRSVPGSSQRIAAEQPGSGLASEAHLVSETTTGRSGDDSGA